MNKNIFLFWMQGLNNAPDVVKRSVESWYVKNPDTNIVLIDRNNIRSYMSGDYVVHDDTNHDYSRQISDLLRLDLMKNYGGVWSDATVFCNKPIHPWLEEQDVEDFFCFSYPKPDRKLASWFLYANKGSELIEFFYQRMVESWNKTKTNSPYFLIHNTFERCYQESETVRNVWDKMPKVTVSIEKSEGAHLFVPYELSYADVADQKKILDDDSPVYKLNWRMIPKEGSSVHWLLNRR